VTVRYTLLVLVVLIASGALIVHVYDVSPGDRGAATRHSAVAKPHRPAPYGSAPAHVRVTMRFKHAPRDGALFDLRTGRVLWSRGLHRTRPIASLAKMMTAIVVNDRARDRERVFISARARQEPGSAVGLLPPHRRVRLRLLLYGLLLPSGNDAAVALAEHVAGSVSRFVRLMNAKARALGLRCSHFSSPDGYEDRGNRSCPRDLAVLAHEVLRRPRLARVVRTDYISFPSLLPHTAKVKRHGKRRKITVWKPGRLYLATHNPLLVDGYPGVTGIKTGYTDAAGRCLVATARRRGVSLGVVLLHSPDPGGQAERLLTRGFHAVWRSQARARARLRALG
jgi:serine-type D-Ala-D-Ala carboxypeptidase (penicillin-binding protein 5/6)